MKKALITFLLICVMMVSFAVPVMANTAVAEETVKEAAYQEFMPFTDMTRIYHRMSNGRLQFRVWGINSMRWLTDWTYV